MFFGVCVVMLRCFYIKRGFPSQEVLRGLDSDFDKCFTTSPCLCRLIWILVVSKCYKENEKLTFFFIYNSFVTLLQSIDNKAIHKSSYLTCFGDDFGLACLYEKKNVINVVHWHVISIHHSLSMTVWLFLCQSHAPRVTWRWLEANSRMLIYELLTILCRGPKTSTWWQSSTVREVPYRSVMMSWESLSREIFGHDRSKY